MNPTTNQPDHNPTNSRRANNLIQTLRRTAHGFTNPQNYAARGLLLT